MAEKKKRPPTALQILRQQKKYEFARGRANDQERILRGMAEKFKGRKEIVVDGDEVYQVYVGYGVFSPVETTLLGKKSDLAEMLR